VILSLILNAIVDEPIKAYVLAGQSNMQGHGMVKADLARNEGRGSFEAYAKGRPQLMAERDDVQIWYLDRVGKLRPGYGHREGYIGPELGFGHVMGDDSEAPILLIKVCWGGKSLGADFRPPSAGGEVGSFYKQLVDHVTSVVADPAMAGLKGKKIELAGFGWHQGWNDRVNQPFVDEYEVNMVKFIRDIRIDLSAPDLPFVIAESGMTGPTEKHPRAVKLMKAQASATRRSEWNGSVGFCRTRRFWRDKANSPTGQGYHWNSNAETYWLIGQAMGREMLRITADSGA
jgi:alpha-galactosidase